MVYKALLLQYYQYHGIFIGSRIDAYDILHEQGVLGQMVRRSELRLWLIEGLMEYIIGISEATKRMGEYPDLQSEDFLQSHIEDLHHPCVSWYLCEHRTEQYSVTLYPIAPRFN